MSDSVQSVQIGMVPVVVPKRKAAARNRRQKKGCRLWQCLLSCCGRPRRPEHVYNTASFHSSGDPSLQDGDYVEMQRFDIDSIYSIDSEYNRDVNQPSTSQQRPLTTELRNSRTVPPPMTNDPRLFLSDPGPKTSGQQITTQAEVHQNF
ncbi:uncharacterized protein LOC131937292 isoform X2 [Physella acuta]|nr:uncharacterized protein LOC131937292 isoform X2 [Physella acuta]